MSFSSIAPASASVPARDPPSSSAARPRPGRGTPLPEGTPRTLLDDRATAALDDPPEQAIHTRRRTLADGRVEARTALRLGGITCAACALPIEAALHAVDGVAEARVQAAAERAEVCWDPARTRLSALVDAVRRAGYEAVPDGGADARALRRREARQAHWRLFVAGFCMMQVMMVAWPAYVAAPGEIPADQLRLLQWAAWLMTLPVMLFSTAPLWRGAWQALRGRRIGMDVPVVIGLAVAFVASSGATFDPGGVFGHEVWFDSVTMFVFLLLAGRGLETRARHRAAEVLEAAVQRLPDRVERLDDDGRGRWVGVRALRPGDRVRIQIGQAFPADGCVLSGRSRADEALLSGESAPVAKGPGDAVVAGSTNLVAPLVMRADRLGADTRHQAIVDLMREAATQRPASVRAADALAGPFLWAVLLLAAGAAAVWSLVDPSRAWWVAVSVLIVTCPCALSLATPSVLLAATGALARRGVLLQHLDALERLARVDRVVFDKTGTLTDDRLVPAHWRRLPAAEGDDVRLLSMATSLAAWSTHPASRAVQALAPVASGGASASASPWTEVVERPGRGVQARSIDGRLFRLGHADWVASCAPDADAEADTGIEDRDDDVDEDGLVVCFGPVGQPWLRFTLGESLRVDAESTLARLRADGLALAVLSGDRSNRVAAVASRLHVAEWRGDARPEDKLAALAAWQARGECVLMVGDGLNDGPVLARADVSFAFAHGSPLSRLQSDAVLLSPRLAEVAEALHLARRARQAIRQNLAWAATYNAVCVPLALGGLMPPWAAGLGMAFSALFVLLNALRVARWTSSSC